MFTRWLLASLHLIALGIGLGAVVVRAALLRRDLASPELRRLFAADTVWGLAALLWISTGLLRAFAGFEKGSGYYLNNVWFWTKMGLLMLVLILELMPMTSLIRWRIAAKRGVPIDFSRARLFSQVSAVQAVLVVGMVFAATAMARGFGN